MQTALGYASLGSAFQTDEAYGAFRQGALVLGAVCDGSGPTGGGEPAAQLAIRTFFESLYDDSAEPTRVLNDALRLANRVLFDSGRSRPSAAGRSVRAALVVVRGDRAFVAHVGDARVYLIRGGQPSLLTRDHVVANLILKDPSETPVPVGSTGVDERAVLRALGRDRDVIVDTRDPVLLQPGDALLLTTAGLIEALGDDLDSVEPQATAEEVATRLIELAAGAGATCGAVVVLKAESEPDRSMAPTAVPEVERPADLLTPSSADLELVARLSGESLPSARPSRPRPSSSRARPDHERARAQELARQRVLLGAIMAMSIVAIFLLWSLLVG